MRTILCAAAIAALAANLCACATVTRGTSTQFKVVSTPPGATVKTSTGFSCAPTPCQIKLPRKRPFDATISLAGYQSQTLHIRSVVGGGGAAGFAGNAVAGGFLGMAVDGTDGAMNDLKPNPLNVTLQAAPAPDTAAPAATPASAPADQSAPHAPTTSAQ